MGLRYTVELKPRRGGYQASIRKIPECTVSVPASDSVEKLWQLLEKNQREWIERELEMGREVPEPPGATRDPFWEKFEEGNPSCDEEEVRSTLYQYGVIRFPFRILEELWLRELRKVRLGEDGPFGAPPKAEVDHGDQRIPWRQGDARPVRLGEGGDKWAWIELEGPQIGRASCR